MVCIHNLFEKKAINSNAICQVRKSQKRIASKYLPNKVLTSLIFLLPLISNKDHLLHLTKQVWIGIMQIETERVVSILFPSVQ
jgi:hypothetical protein